MAVMSILTVIALLMTANHFADGMLAADETEQLAQCSTSTFTSILPSGAKIEKVDLVLNGSYGEGASNLGYPGFAIKLPPVCAVTVNVTSSSSSSYRFGLFLPTATNWNSNFLAVGNGAFLGGINWPEMGSGPHYGMATMSTDTGHNSGSGDLSWALNAPDKQADWGYRAVHGSATLAKQLTEAYYAKPISRSIWSGCSTGGRQGLKEIQISPDTFDGALIGAPAWDTAHLMPWVTKVGTNNLPNGDPKTFNSTDQYALISQFILRQCDTVDGVTDNIVSTPDACKPNWTQITCGQAGVDPSKCLLPEQVQTSQNLLDDYYTSTGDFVHSGLDLSSADQWDIYTLYGNADNFDTSYEKCFLYNDPTWSWTQFNDSVAADSARLNRGNASANAYDLSAFRDRGGKIVMYHGLADGIVPTRTSGVYYNRTMAAMGSEDMQSWFRYFLVPGMQHCYLSPTTVNAPWMFAGPNQNVALGARFNPGYGVPGFQGSAEHDMLLALLGWVENGTAVDSITATAWNVLGGVDLEVARQRPICPWPKIAAYGGKGDVNSAEAWACEDAAGLSTDVGSESVLGL